MRLVRGARALEIRFPDSPAGELKVLEASVDPIGGWVSRAFDHKQSAPTLVWRARLSGRSVLHTEISISG
jgi:hypothetical protein